MYIYICKFQFHYGTIKSHTGHEYPRRERYFNSTMVRLKDSKRNEDIAFFVDFNSTMVRLKASPQPAVTPTMVFQFHYGTIKSKYPLLLC